MFGSMDPYDEFFVVRIEQNYGKTSYSLSSSFYTKHLTFRFFILLTITILFAIAEYAVYKKYKAFQSQENTSKAFKK